jgi:uncharacterized membrane protein YeaQ/YmgE (transglycosylase-associated protein family)
MIPFQLTLPRLCEYSDIAGMPGLGAHFHEGGFAVVDILMTFLGALILQWIFTRFSTRFSGKLNYLGFFTALFSLSILLHHIFCVCSTVNDYLFPNDPMCFHPMDPVEPPTL